MAEEKQLLSCDFFARLDFFNTFFHFNIENDDSSPLSVAMCVLCRKNDNNMEKRREAKECYGEILGKY